MGEEFSNYLAYVVFLCVSSPEWRRINKEKYLSSDQLNDLDTLTNRRLNLRKEGWPQFPTPAIVSFARHWIFGEFKKICENCRIEIFPDKGDFVDQLHSKEILKNEHPANLAKILNAPLLPSVIRSQDCKIDNYPVRHLTGTRKTRNDKLNCQIVKLDKIIPKASGRLSFKSILSKVWDFWLNPDSSAGDGVRSHIHTDWGVRCRAATVRGTDTIAVCQTAYHSREHRVCLTVRPIGIRGYHSQHCRSNNKADGVCNGAIINRVVRGKNDRQDICSRTQKRTTCWGVSVPSLDIRGSV
jgi:hypothetical protein